MSDVSVYHEFDPSRKGTCKTLVGGRKRGYWHCGLTGGAKVHQAPVIIGWQDWDGNIYLFKERKMTDTQLVQNLVAQYFDCMVCTDTGKKLCEMHQADERSEVERQDSQCA